MRDKEETKKKVEARESDAEDVVIVEEVTS